ncbi:hypothetical protein [Clostridium sp. HBUAS56010]|uniref:hypothetical protein n=1 Tax=Clostridium sp. HBUAS56010 TaxID=2571127 RepID=UPI001FA9D340|nr:hypothetical protein [Clostridium sp. HBUAS56010]
MIEANKENLHFYSEVIDIAEHKTYLELTSRICYYDDINANNVMLPYDEATEDKAKTLVNMPVQAKYKTNTKGEPTFGSHEMYKDGNGNLLFNTSSIGTHTEIYIQEETITTVKGETKTLPCLFAKYRIWKRYKNVIQAVKRLFDLGKLFSSWEILTFAYEFKDGVKKITDYEFEANTLLGFEYARPSYGTSATAISLASEGNEMMIAEALSQDLAAENSEETEGGFIKDMKKDNINTPETNDPAQTEVSQLTDWDLREKIRKACSDKIDKWCWPSFHFPVEKEVWCEYEGRETELDYLRFTYEVENDVVTVSDPEPVKLAVSAKAINSTVAELNSKITTKDDALIKASETISTLKTEISELEPYKDKFEKAEQEKIDREVSEKKEKLIASVTKTGFITKEEIETSEEFKGFINSLDEKSLKAIVAERYIASLEEKENNKTITANETETASTNLNFVDEDVVDKKSIMKEYLGGK